MPARLADPETARDVVRAVFAAPQHYFARTARRGV
jgi:hypothetical protein